MKRLPLDPAAESRISAGTGCTVEWDRWLRPCFGRSKCLHPAHARCLSSNVSGGQSCMSCLCQRLCLPVSGQPIRHLRNPWNETAIAAHNIRRSWSGRLVLRRTRSQSWRSTGVVIGWRSRGELGVRSMPFSTQDSSVLLAVGYWSPRRADFARLTYTRTVDGCIVNDRWAAK